ncbi:hypothetical protein [uncultured Shimia sp.]|uniref:hypothetical protein n=1 Tax=uncultured Shimia sp. TaxID=573152 RepID=UPI002625301D|nr:hypothetical protein [uncultured Shimia sp.]
MFRAMTWAIVAMLVGGAVGAETPTEAEDQTVTGQFLTATEVRPILGATQGNWIAVREFNGQDLLYFTHLLSWRCGLYGISFAINGGEMQDFPMAACDVNAPMTIPPDAVIYLEYPLGSIETIDVELLYDDLGTGAAQFQRQNVMTP